VQSLSEEITIKKSVKVQVKVNALSHFQGNLPEYQTADASGCDVVAALGDRGGDTDVCIKPGKRALIPTGLTFEIPKGFEIQVRPRSGLAWKSGITVLNSPGTIDADYRGEVKVILINHGDAPFAVRRGDRIAQLVVAPVSAFAFHEATELDVTERGAGGFGSTGVRHG